MAVEADADGTLAVEEHPPDVMGPTGPVPRSIWWTGVTALIVAAGGLVAVQIAYALWGSGVTEACRAAGIFFDPSQPVGQQGVTGAEGVCNIVTGLESGWTTLFLWGGIAIGLVAVIWGILSYKKQDTRRKRRDCITGAIIGFEAILVAAFFLWFRSGNPGNFVLQFLDFEYLSGSIGGFVRGAINTLLLAFGGEVGGIMIGLLLSVMTLSAFRAVRAPARGYINFFRGTPLLWQLSFFWSGIVLGLNLPLKNNVFLAAIVVFSLNTGAYAAEVFRAGIQSIERGQMEAARSLGMSYAKAMRIAIVPQAIRRVIPPLMNEFVILIKDTSLVIALGLSSSQLDLYNFARQGYSDTYNATWFVGAAIGYLVITLPMIRLVNIAEKKLRSGLVGVGGAGI